MNANKRQTIDIKDVKGIFELDELELAYRYKKVKGLAEESLVIIKTTKPYETWANMYNESSKDQDLYNFIIDNIEAEAVNILQDENKADFLDKHSDYDMTHDFKTECIKKVLEFNNIRLKYLVTAKDVAILLADDMYSYGSVKEYVLSTEFMQRLIQDNLIDLSLKSPF